MSDLFSEFVQESRKEKERASIDFNKEVGDAGFHLRARGGKKAIEKLAKILNEVV